MFIRSTHMGVVQEGTNDVGVFVGCCEVKRGGPSGTDYGGRGVAVVVGVATGKSRSINICPLFN